MSDARQESMFRDQEDLPLFSAAPIPVVDQRPDPPKRRDDVPPPAPPMFEPDGSEIDTPVAPGHYRVTFADPCTLPGWAVFGAKVNDGLQWVVYRNAVLVVVSVEVKGAGTRTRPALILLGGAAAEAIAIYQDDTPLHKPDELIARSRELARQHSTPDCPAWCWPVPAPPERIVQSHLGDTQGETATTGHDHLN